jgi:hypothetical protein
MTTTWTVIAIKKVHFNICAVQHHITPQIFDFFFKDGIAFTARSADLVFSMVILR